MSVRKAFIGLVFVAVLVGVATFLNRPKQRPFPFSGPLELLPDYQSPGEGVTLYPTGGPFGIDVIEAIAKGRGEVLFVGTYGGGIFKTEDNGAHWHPANRGLRDKFISSLIILKDGTIFASTIRAGLFKSEDNGAHWVSANTGLEKTDVRTMTILSNGDILTGTGSGVYLSRDSGMAWVPFNKGLANIEIQSIIATKDQTLFAATQGLGIFKRPLNSEKWVSVVKGFVAPALGLEERSIRALVIGRNEAIFAGTMSAGIFRSVDGGEHWGSANTGLGNFSIRTLSVDGAGKLYAGTGEGVFYSKDDGMRWDPLVEGMNNIQIHSFVTSESGDLLAGSGNGVYRGKIGSAWESFEDQLLISPVRALDYGQELITVGTEGKGTYVNQGDNWMSDNLALGNLSIQALAHGQVFLYAVTNDGLYRRQLGHHQWTLLKGLTSKEPIVVGVDARDHVYIGSKEGLFSSADHGISWVKETEVGSEAIKALSIADNSLFAATENSIWSKSPEGVWKKIITKEGRAFQLILWRPKKGLLAVTNQKIWEWDLQGVWRELKSGGPEGVQMLSIATDPHNDDILYAGTDHGLFWSVDNAGSWQRANLYQGIPFEGKVNQVLPTQSVALWLATEKDGVVIGISKDARRTTLEIWLDVLNNFEFSS